MRSSVIVVVVDRWHVGTLGAYGNTWLSTPELDRLAAESFLFDQALADSPDLAPLYRSLWQGRAAIEPSGTESRNVAAILAAVDFATALLTDEPEVDSLPDAALFGERTLLEHPPATRLADDVEQTQLYRLFSAAIDTMQRLPEPFLLWVHARAMSGPWDAPSEFRQRLVEEDDPDPATFVEPPCRMLPDDVDPDEVLAGRTAYGGQALLLDDCLGWLLDNLRESQLAERCLLSVQGLRGFPLGEHGRLGRCDDALHAELVHIPWLLRFPERLGALSRSAALVQPCDLLSTIVEWLGLPRSETSGWSKSLLPVVRGELDWVRDRVGIIGGSAASHGEYAIRTPAWHLRVPHEGPVELYQKPDDRWEANDVADRCAEIVEQLRGAFEETTQYCRNVRADLPEMSAALVQQLE